MSSAFRRAGAKNSSSAQKSPSLLGARGVKPWAGGIHLTSVGLNDLDTILGGGQPLGTCILIQEDRWTRDLALSLVKYWCAEAISQEQNLIIPISDTSNSDNSNDFLPAVDQTSRAGVEDLLLSLPKNLHWEKQKQKEKAQQKIETPDALGILEEGEEDDEEKADEGLEIAWQYRKSVQQERLAQQPQTKPTALTTNVFCHSYDLSGRMNGQNEIEPSKYIVEMKSSTDAIGFNAKGFELFRKLVSSVKSKEGKATRMLLFHPDGDEVSVALPLFLSYIRKMSLPVVVLVCMLPTSCSNKWTKLARSCDVVLSTEGFSGRKEYPPPPEFRHLQGLLKISKVSTVTASTANGGGHYGDLTISKRPAAFIYGCKRDRRKLHIPLLHIPPEDYAEGGGSVGSGVRSGAGKVAAKKKSGGMGCSSNMSGSALDF